MSESDDERNKTWVGKILRDSEVERQKWKKRNLSMREIRKRKNVKENN